MIRRLTLAAFATLTLVACQQQEAAAPVETASTEANPAAATQAGMAPAFTLVDAEGTQRSLADFRGKTVVLEWTNEGCPYVQKHYGAGAMQALQREATGDGVVWLTIVSSAPGAQGFVEGEAARAFKAKHDGAWTHCCWIRPARSASCTTPRPRRTCGSSIPRAASSSRAASTTGRPTGPRTWTARPTSSARP
ncbi:redoxin domain-containing protein [Brevundimonas albigilva]|uniref:redoxin family protein n=1 Tax=Brevundimonas albigilva TaxID=1312364 RepID=UPI00201B7AA4|nr:redoxin family protein [Brevundimonas albigilva]UQV17186.1 redoxin domain-containing protein [Brevundimonas albigilva]